jgi:hypothetical protein
MRATRVLIEPTSDGSRLSACLVWDDRPRPDFELVIEASGASAILPDQAGNALVTALFPIAFHDEEHRIAIDAPVCPMLVDNLSTVLGWWNRWSDKPPCDIRIETQRATVSCAGRQPATAFFSGGVDSFHMLHRNRKLYGRGNPAFIERAIIVHGFDVGRRKRNAEEPLFAGIRKRIEDAVLDQSLQVATCRTNLRHIALAPGFWTDRFYGAAAFAMGHAAVAGPSYLMLAGTHDIDNLSPIGSNPAVDIQFSSQRLQVVHEGARFSRLQKVRELLEWPTALDNLRVCAQGGRTDYNCRECEKCLRTRLELLVVGCEETKAFGASAFDPALLQRIEIENDYQAACYRDIARACSGRTLSAYAKAIDARLAAYRDYLETGDQRSGT